MPTDTASRIEQALTERIIEPATDLEASFDKLSVSVLRVKRERDEFRVALEQIAALNDESANGVLELTGSYRGFDEPGSVEIARVALQKAWGE